MVREKEGHQPHMCFHWKLNGWQTNGGYVKYDIELKTLDTQHDSYKHFLYPPHWEHLYHKQLEMCGDFTHTWKPIKKVKKLV